MRVEARTSLGSSARQITMTDNLRFREHLMKDGQQICHSFRLGWSTGIARQSVLVQSTLVADADRTVVIRNGMSTDLQQHPVLRHRSILADIEK